MWVIKKPFLSQNHRNQLQGHSWHLKATRTYQAKKKTPKNRIGAGSTQSVPRTSAGSLNQCLQRQNNKKIKATKKPDRLNLHLRAGIVIERKFR